MAGGIEGGCAVATQTALARVLEEQQGAATRARSISERLQRLTEKLSGACPSAVDASEPSASPDTIIDEFAMIRDMMIERLDRIDNYLDRLELAI